MIEFDPNFSNHEVEEDWNSYMKRMNLHFCEKMLPEYLYGAAIYECSEDEDGRLTVTNGEYGSQVNFCPFCGYKAKVPIQFGPGPGDPV